MTQLQIPVSRVPSGPGLQWTSTSQSDRGPTATCPTENASDQVLAMLADILGQSPTISAGTSGSYRTVQKRAFYLNDDGRSLFAWLHTHRSEECFDHGVVICSPIGFEQLHAHRGLRHLADQLAHHQIPALRFDWHGTGDSAGDDSDPNRLTAWRANVHAAVSWMKTRCGCRQVSIVGLRMGATIASLSLNDAMDIENLVLWDPVTTGRSYVREMTLIDMMSEARPATGTDNDGTIDAAGFLLSRETTSETDELQHFAGTPAVSSNPVGGYETMPQWIIA